MTLSIEYCKESQKFFKDKIHAITNAISHASDPNEIHRLELLLSYAEKDWEKYTKLIDEIRNINSNPFFSFM